MLATKLVIPASHSLTHQPLTTVNAKSLLEITASKELLTAKTGQAIETFIYPYGKMSWKINRFVNQHYRFAMRIGSACNWNWHNVHNVCYRINADEFWPHGKSLFTDQYKKLLWLRCLSNTLRFK
jgi:hypothetical protein